MEQKYAYFVHGEAGMRVQGHGGAGELLQLGGSRGRRPAVQSFVTNLVF